MADIRTLTAIELFAGGGSVHLALAEAGIQVEYANDFDAMKQRVYRANFPETRLDPRSIEEVRGHELPCADILHASSPCQDHSAQGQRAGFTDGSRGRMAFHVLRLLGEMPERQARPRVVVFENVTGMLSLRGGADFAELCDGLVAQGYLVGGLAINARRFLPQNRERLFIVAVRRDVSVPVNLTTKDPCGAWHPNLLRKAHDALPLQARRAWRWWCLPEPTSPSTDLGELLSHDSEQHKWLKRDRLALMRSLMTSDDMVAIEEARQQGVVAGVTLRKRRRGPDGTYQVRQQVCFDGYARCLLASEGHECQLVISPAENEFGFRARPFTARERARLIGLPDHYALPSTSSTQALTGDAVVVPVYSWLTQHLLKPLALAAVGGVVPRLPPQRRRKEVSSSGAACDGKRSAASRPIKAATSSITLYLTQAEQEGLEAMAAEAGLPKSGYLKELLQRERAARGLNPLPSYVPNRQRASQTSGRTADVKEPFGRRLNRSGRGRSARTRLSDAATPIRYPGGKAKVASRLIRALTGTSSLVEPFAGSAAVSVRAVLTNSVDLAILAEKDDALRQFWRLVLGQDRTEFRGLLHVLEQARPSRDWWREFEVSVEDARGSVPHIEAAHTLLARRFRWGGLPGAGLVADDELARHWRADTMVRRLNAIRREKARFLVMDDAFEAIEQFREDAHASFFVDPPYSLSIGGPASRLYRHHDLDHEALLSALARVSGAVVATYPETNEVLALAKANGFEVQALPIRDGHRRRRRELRLSRPPRQPSSRVKDCCIETYPQRCESLVQRVKEILA